MKNKIIFIVGPTASGKTDISLKIASTIGGEIVAADSMQIYKGIHIASAAPTSAEKATVPHHLFEFLELTDTFSVADYVKKATDTANEILSRGKIPVFVGGTGLYFKSITENLAFTECDTDVLLRSRLEAKYEDLGGSAMLAELAEIDGDTASRLNPNDKKRIVRAFEVYRLTGNTLSKQNEASHKTPSPFKFLKIGIDYSNREILYKNINERVDKMISNGLVKEAESTLSLSNKKGAFQAIGHKEIYPYLSGVCNLATATENLKQQTRRYAKRQLTWFRKDTEINWFYRDCGNNLQADILNTVNNFLKEEN